MDVGAEVDSAPDRTSHKKIRIIQRDLSHDDENCLKNTRV